MGAGQYEVFRSIGAIASERKPMVYVHFPGLQFLSTPPAMPPLVFEYDGYVLGGMRALGPPYACPPVAPSLGVGCGPTLNRRTSFFGIDRTIAPTLITIPLGIGHTPKPTTFVHPLGINYSPTLIVFAFLFPVGFAVAPIIFAYLFPVGFPVTPIIIASVKHSESPLPKSPHSPPTVPSYVLPPAPQNVSPYLPAQSRGVRLRAGRQGTVQELANPRPTDTQDGADLPICPPRQEHQHNLFISLFESCLLNGSTKLSYHQQGIERQKSIYIPGALRVECQLSRGRLPPTLPAHLRLCVRRLRSVHRRGGE